MSRNCNETYYELIGSIVAFPNSAATFTKPFNMEKKSDRPSYTVSESAKVEIPIKKKSGGMTESVSSTVAGERYEVTVTWEIENVDNEAYTILEGLKRETNSLILKTFPDNDMFVRAVEDAYLFEYWEDDGVLSCKAVMQNITGVQRML